jgi:hypothetical protein
MTIGMDSTSLKRLTVVFSDFMSVTHFDSFDLAFFSFFFMSLCFAFIAGESFSD